MGTYTDPFPFARTLTVSRRLKSRHIQFIALGGTIGTGLFLGIGSALTTAGPLGILLGYTITGIAVFAMVGCRDSYFWNETILKTNRCNLWARWPRGCPFLAPFLSSALATSMMPWALPWAGM